MDRNIAQVCFECQQPLGRDLYATNPRTGLYETHKRWHRNCFERIAMQPVLAAHRQSLTRGGFRVVRVAALAS